MPTRSESTASTNNHVREYLQYYCGMPHAPNYAVLAKGPWGVGKTFVVKEIINQVYASRKQKFAYVSLYGLSSIDDIDTALFRALFPALGWKVTRVGLKLASSSLKRLGFTGALSFKDVLTKQNADLYVFDDLERCLVPIKQTLGYINEFIEHLDAKVVIIANEGDIRDDEYKKQREKVIGKILEIQPDFERAFSSFLELVISPSTRAVLTGSREDIESIYGQSGLPNLRLVQQTIWDFERVFGALTKEMQRNELGVKALVRLLFPLSIEYKSGRLFPDVLASRVVSNSFVASLKRSKGEPVTGFEEISARYRGVDLYDTILTNDILVDVLDRGVVDEAAIRKSVLQSTYYTKVESEPAWRTIWHWHERSSEELDGALPKLESQFSDRAFLSAGEFLQVVGLRLFLATEGLISASRDQVVTDAKQAIEDMFNAGKLTTFDLEEVGPSGFGSWNGLGFNDGQTKEFKEVSAFLKARLQQVYQNSLPEKGEMLLQELRDDASLFFRRLCLTNSNDNIYYDIPILSFIPPKSFVDTVLRLPPGAQRVALTVFKPRYENSSFSEKLASEKQWVQDVRKLLLEKATTETGFSRMRLTKFVEWYIDEALEVEASGES